MNKSCKRNVKWKYCGKVPKWFWLRCGVHGFHCLHCIVRLLHGRFFKDYLLCCHSPLRLLNKLHLHFYPMEESIVFSGDILFWAIYKNTRRRRISKELPEVSKEVLKTRKLFFWFLSQEGGGGHGGPQRLASVHLHFIRSQFMQEEGFHWMTLKISLPQFFVLHFVFLQCLQNLQNLYFWHHLIDAFCFTYASWVGILSVILPDPLLHHSINTIYLNGKSRFYMHMESHNHSNWFWMSQC